MEKKLVKWIGISLVAIALIGCGSGPRDGLSKYPVHGKVLINGAPQAGIVVRFVLSAEEKTKSSGRYPVGVTDTNGEFRLSTNGTEDGAVAGEYAVTFLWPERKDPPVGDHFRGAYSRADSPPFRATVNPEKNELGTYDLEMKEESAPPPDPERERLRDPNN